MKFEPEEICAVLVEEGVQFVLVGGLAAVLHGSPLPTVDIDVVPERASENFERLAAALKRLGAKLRTEAGPVEAPMDAAFIQAMPLMLNLVTRSSPHRGRRDRARSHDRGVSTAMERRVRV